MNPSLDVQVRRTPAHLIVSPSRIWIGLLAIAVLGVFVVWQCRPWILWAYNIQRAGAYQASALAYPTPRAADSLPGERNAQANEAALGHIAAAIHWRPDDPYAYRLAALSYMAKGEWMEAASVLEEARLHAGDDPLVAWERVLAYEQVQALARQAPQTPLSNTFAVADVDAPSTTLSTPFCKSNNTSSCYVGLTSFSMPLAESAYTKSVAADTVFVHPPARVTIPLTLPEGQSALSFLLGLDPQAQQWNTDGVTFQAWVVEANGGIIPVYERFIDATQLRQGWTADWIDLAPWAGQSVHLTIGTNAGPAGDNTGDWVGWGAVTLTTASAAASASMDIDGRIHTALVESHIDADELLGRGDDAIYLSHYDEADRWYHRASLTGAVITSTVAYADFVKLQATDGFDAALPMLERAVTADVGWSHPSRRFNAFFTYGRYLTGQKEYVEGERYLRAAIASLPPNLTTGGEGNAEAYWWLAVALQGLDQYPEALHYAEIAAQLNTGKFYIQSLYGILLYQNDPTQMVKIEAVLKRALSLEENAANWQSIIAFWLDNDEEERALAYCQQALNQFTAEQLNNICWSGDTASSSTLYLAYVAARASGNQEEAYTRLEEAVTSDSGWRNPNDHFRAWEAWAVHLYEDGRYSDAIDALQKAISLIGPDVRPSVQGALYARLARSYTAEKQYDQAIPNFEQALDLVADTYLYFDYAIALYNTEPRQTSFEAVNSAFTSAIAQSPQPSETRARVINFWYEMRKSTVAEEWCTTAEGDTLAAVLCTNGLSVTSGDAYRQYLALREEDPDNAIEYLEVAITEDAGWQQLSFRYQAWRAWSDHLYTSGDYEESITAIRTAIDATDIGVANDTLSEGYRLLGLAYSGQSDNEAAIEAFKTAITLNKSNAWAYIHYGKTLYVEDNRQLTKVRELLETAVTILPDDVILWQSVLSFWREIEDTENFVAFCSLAGETMRTAVGGWCWNREGTSSQEWYAQYRQSLRANETEAAYEALSQAVEVDGGWRDGKERFAAWQAWSLYIVEQGDNAKSILALAHTLTLIPASTETTDVLELHQLLATAYRAEEQFSNAAVQYENILALDETDMWSHIYLGQSLYLADKANTANTRLEFARALELAGDDVVPWQFILSFWWRQTNQEETAALCEQSPNSIRATIDIQCWDGNNQPSALLYNQYIVALQDRNNTQAFAALQSAIQVDSGWANVYDRYSAWQIWARHLWQESKFDEAVGTFEKVLEIVPANIASLQISEVYHYYGLSLWGINRQRDALEALAQSVTVDDSNLWAHIHYGKFLYSFESRPTDEVRQEFTRALEIAADDPVIWQNILAYWVGEGEYQDAQDLCSEVSAAIKDEVSLYCWAGSNVPSTVYYDAYRQQFQENHQEAAYDALEQAVTVNGGWRNIQDRFTAWRTWSLHLVSVGGRSDETLLALQTTLAVAPPDVDPKVLSEPARYLGLLYSDLKEYEQALASLQNSVQYDPNNKWAHIHYGKVLYLADFTNKADTVREFDLALTLAGNDAVIWDNLIQFWIGVGQKPEAQGLCNRVAATPQIGAIEACTALP